MHRLTQGSIFRHIFSQVYILNLKKGEHYLYRSSIAVQGYFIKKVGQIFSNIYNELLAYTKNRGIKYNIEIKIKVIKQFKNFGLIKNYFNNIKPLTINIRF